MIMTGVRSWMVCMQCWEPATQFFDGNHNWPICGRRVCDEQAIEEINNELIDVAAEATKEALELA